MLGTDSRTIYKWHYLPIQNCVPQFCSAVWIRATSWRHLHPNGLNLKISNIPSWKTRSTNKWINLKVFLVSLESIQSRNNRKNNQQYYTYSAPQEGQSSLKEFPCNSASFCRGIPDLRWRQSTFCINAWINNHISWWLTTPSHEKMFRNKTYIKCCTY